MERDRSGFFTGLAGAGRGVSLNPALRRKREEDDEDSWEEESEEEEEVEMDAEEAEEEEEPEAAGEEAEEEEEPEGGDDDGDDEAEEAEEAAAAAPMGAIRGAETVTIASGQEQDKTSWLDIPLHKSIRHAVAECGWVMPTPVQCKAIPAALNGYDICCRAVTGSGKTGAFLLPMLQSQFERSQQRGYVKQCIRYVVVQPTRELAMQCFNTLEQLTQGMGFTKSLVIGGLSVQAQLRELRNRPDAVVATPGRLIDSLRNAPGVTLEGLEILVLDEADRLLSEGFRAQLEELLRFCPKKRQTLLLSATMTKEVNELAELSLTKPLNIDVGHVAVAQNLTQEFVRLPKGDTEDRSRLPLLLALCTHEFKRGVIVFCSSKSRAQRVTALLQLCAVPADQLHQERTQNERLETLDKFRSREVCVLVTTEVSARGLDIEGVRTVINYDMPADVTDYVHRVGRTARIGRKGRSVSFIAERDTDLLKKIVKLSKISAERGSAEATVGAVKKRVVSDERLAEAQAKVDALKEKVTEAVLQQRMDRELAEAERRVEKQQNTLAHLDAIKARPKATWFLSEKEKKETRKRSRAEMEQVAAEDLDDFATGKKFHLQPRKEGEFGSKRAKLEELAEAEMSKQQKPAGDKYGKLYQPQKIEKPRGKSLKRANRADWLAKRREVKQKKLDKAAQNRKGSAKKLKSGKDKKKEWNFSDRKGVGFKSKKRYKRR